jgi:hypothetical protein
LLNFVNIIQRLRNFLNSVSVKDDSVSEQSSDIRTFHSLTDWNQYMETAKKVYNATYEVFFGGSLSDILRSKNFGWQCSEARILSFLCIRVQ